jgi:diguanylate cyclase (GGDEF)-like protein
VQDWDVLPLHRDPRRRTSGTGRRAGVGRERPVSHRESWRQAVSEVLVGGLAQGWVSAIRSRIDGVHVHVADTGAQVLERLAARPCNLLILDHSLPDLAAPDVVRRLTEGASASSIPVLYCASSEILYNGERLRIERLGVRHFLHYPFDADDLIRTVSELIGGGASNGAGGRVVRPNPPEGFVEGLAALAPPGPTGDPARLAGSLARRMDVLDRVAVSLLEGSFDTESRGRVRKEAADLAAFLVSLGRLEAARHAHDLEILLDLPDGRIDTLRVSQLVVALRNELDRPIATADSAGIGDTRPLLVVVDDDAGFGESVSLEAEARGLRFQRAGTAGDLRELLCAERPAVVLIDLDGESDSLDGFGLIAELVDNEPPVPVLVTAATASLVKRIAVARAGGHTFLRKPAAPAAIVDAAIGAIRRSETAGCRVLCVDDDDWTVTSLRERLEPLRIDVTGLNDARRFTQTMESVRPDVVLLDIDTPHHSGLELCRVLRGDERWAGTPVMILGDGADAAAMHLAFLAGADDFVPKPILSSEITIRIANRLERVRLTRHQAGVDPLTGVSTRSRAADSLQSLLRLAARDRKPFSLASINIDGLREVNETAGPAMGDAVLRRLARLLRNSFRVEDVVARSGGDQLALGAFGIEKDDCVRRLRLVAERFRAEVFRAGETEIHATFSAGVSALYDDGHDLAALQHAADDSLSYAKTVGRGTTLPAGWSPARATPTEVIDVALVERDAPLAGLLLHALEQQGRTTLWFKDADEVIEALCGSHPRLRARSILLEVDLPGRDGFTVLRALGRDDVLARSRVIMLTARANEPEVLKAFELGAWDHVAKPFSVQILLQRVSRAIGG